jgi:hypothetical protein
VSSLWGWRATGDLGRTGVWNRMKEGLRTRARISSTELGRVSVTSSGNVVSLPYSRTQVFPTDLMGWWV